MKHRFSHSLGFKFLLYILLFSSAITFAFTALQLFIDYRTERDQIDVYFQQINDSYLDTLVYAVWIDEHEQVMGHLEGIARLPDVEFLEISKKNVLIASLGSLTSRHFVVREYPLVYTYNNQEYNLGMLAVNSTLENIHYRLIDKVLVIVASQAIKTLLVSGFIFLIFYLVVGRHLQTLAEYTKTLNVDKLDVPPPIIRSSSTSRENELDQLAFSLNEMRKGFSQSVQELNSHRHHLEELVAERTVELKKANEELTDSEERFRSLSDAAIEGIVITEQGRIIEANAAMVKMIGYQLSELMDMLVVDLIPPEEKENVKSKILSGYELPYESSCLRKDGLILPIEVHARMFLYRGRQVRVAAIRDLSEQKKAEEEIKTLREILPICSFCKNIRNDEGYYEQIEGYLHKYSGVDFSHTICPSCMEKHYPAEYVSIVSKKNN